MDKITPQEFLYKQPAYPETKVSDPYYHAVANHLLELWEKNDCFQELQESLIKRIAVNITSYFQDIISDAGIWRSFVNANRTLYGYSVPFHNTGEEYVDYELNIEDLRFLVWYNISMLDDDHRMLYPHDSQVLRLADIWFAYLDEIYEDSPLPDGFNISMGLEFHDPEDQENIYHLGTWLFLHSYLLTPAFAITMHEIMSDKGLLQSNDLSALQNRIEQAMSENPTGPLALYISEWIKLIIQGELPKSNEVTENKEHPYYQKFIKATGGKVIKYFGSYGELNTFLVESLGWSREEEHLSVLKNARNIILMVNKEKGMLAARNIAEYISDPLNPYYNKDIAGKDAISLFTQRGKCPVDLLKYACINNYLPDACFPESDDYELVKQNWDFIARCYLQQYYRD